MSSRVRGRLHPARLLAPAAAVALALLTAGSALADPTSSAPPTIQSAPIGADGFLQANPQPTLTMSTGTWSTTGNPLSYAYQWQSCSYPNLIRGDGPTAYYRFGEPAGSTQVADSSGLGEPTIPMSISSTLGDAGHVAGDGDTAITIPYHPVVRGIMYMRTPGDEFTPVDYPTGTSPLSIEAWIKPNGTPTGDGFIFSIGAETGADSSLELETYNTGSVVRLAAFDGLRQYVATSGSIVVGTWYHVVLTYDGTSIRLYQNGALVGTFAEQPSFSLVPTVARLDGRIPMGIPPQDFGGTIDELAVYSYALDATTISNHYAGTTNADSALRCADIPGQTNQSYTVTDDLSGTRIRGQVTASNDTGTTSAWTTEVAASGKVVVPPTPDLTQVQAYGPTVVNGTVVDDNGGPVAGVRVSLYGALGTRTMVAEPLLAEAVTDSQGQYALQLQDSGVTGLVTNANDGWLNLHLVVHGFGVYSEEFLTRQYDPNDGAWTDSSGNPQTGSWVDDQGATPAPEQVTLTTVGPLGGVSRANPFNGGCPPSVKHKVDDNTAWKTIQELHIWTYETGNLSYNVGSSTQIQGAISPNLGGPYSVSGSFTISHGSNYFSPWPPTSSPWAELGQAAVDVICYKWTHPPCSDVHYTQEADHFLGTERWATQSGLSGNDGNCPHAVNTNTGWKGRGTTFGRGNSSGYSYTAGTSLFGIALGATSAFTTTDTETWTTSKTPPVGSNYLFMCGDGSGNAWYNAKRVYMGPWYSTSA